MDQTVEQMTVLAGHFNQHNSRLVTYLSGLLLPDKHRHVEDLAQTVWIYAFQIGDTTDTKPDTDSGLPAYLARLARAVARREASPATADEIEILIGYRGDESILAAAAPPPPPRAPKTSALSYAVAHGAPATWRAAEIEVQQNLAAIEAAARSATVLTTLHHKEPAALSPAA